MVSALRVNFERAQAVIRIFFFFFFFFFLEKIRLDISCKSSARICLDDSYKMPNLLLSEGGCFAFLWFVVCVLSVMVCLLFLCVSLVGFVL